MLIIIEKDILTASYLINGFKKVTGIDNVKFTGIYSDTNRNNKKHKLTCAKNRKKRLKKRK